LIESYTVTQCVQLQARGPPVAHHSVFSGPQKYSEKKREI